MDSTSFNPRRAAVALRFRGVPSESSGRWPGLQTAEAITDAGASSFAYFANSLPWAKSKGRVRRRHPQRAA